MKFKAASIKADVTFIEEPGISFRDSYPSDKWVPEYDVCIKTYKNFINEWDKNLFAPYELICDIMKRLSGESSSMLIRYHLADVLSASSLKRHRQFKQTLANFDKDRFNLFVLFVDGPLSLVESSLKSHHFDDETIIELKAKIADRAFFMLNDVKPPDGCVIVVNGGLVDSNDVYSIGEHIDNELKNYFMQFDRKETFPEKLKRSFLTMIEKLKRLV